MKTIATNIRLQFNEKHNVEIVLTVKRNIDNISLAFIAELKGIISNGKELSVEIKQYRKQRSLDANALLWKMCTEIANVIRSTKDEIYLQMLERYGVFTHIIVKPEAVDRVVREWRTARVLGEVTVNNKTGIQVMCFFGSHSYDSKEFSVLLDGVISEAKELGIEVISNSEKNLILQEWGK